MYEIILNVNFHFFLKVQMHNGDVYEANIRDIDKKSDIATIKINAQVRPQLSDHDFLNKFADFYFSHKKMWSHGEDWLDLSNYLRYFLSCSSLSKHIQLNVNNW